MANFMFCVDMLFLFELSSLKIISAFVEVLFSLDVNCLSPNFKPNTKSGLDLHLLQKCFFSLNLFLICAILVFQCYIHNPYT